MKVGIVTLHKVLNFGSVLQAYCTCLRVRRLGYEPEIVNYMQPRYTIMGSVSSIWREAFSGGMKRAPAAFFRSVLKTISYFIQRHNFERFVRGYLPVGRGIFTSFRALVRTPPNADIYMTGSDQVWNSEYNQGVDSCHYLDFAPQGRPRISYAASFGKDSIPEKERLETQTLLKKYLSIGVRESSAVKIAEDLGVQGAVHVLDPTMLLSREEWFAEFKPKRLMDEPYLLIYSVERSLDSLVYRTARRVADERNLKIMFLSQAAALRSMSGCDVQKSFASVEDFVSAFYFADYVVASSFHGTAFSINFNRQFASVLPPKFGARPRSLLNLVGLTGRIVEADSDESQVITPIDYEKVNVLLEKERAASNEFLRRILADAAMVC